MLYHVTVRACNTRPSTVVRVGEALSNLDQILPAPYALPESTPYSTTVGLYDNTQENKLPTGLVKCQWMYHEYRVPLAE